MKRAALAGCTSSWRISNAYVIYGASWTMAFAIACALGACSSGKRLYEQGDYYASALQAIERLRQQPENKDAAEALRLSYPLLLERLESTDALTAGDSPYRKKLERYTQVNRLYEEIKACPAAMRIVPKPINRYGEMDAVKEGAAEEFYNEGIQAMLKNTREEAKKAYYAFVNANALSVGYKESLEMASRAKDNATIYVVLQPPLAKRSNDGEWGFESAVFGGLSEAGEFVKLLSSEQAQRDPVQRIDQVIFIDDRKFVTTSPQVSSQSQNFSNIVRVTIREAPGIFRTVDQLVYASITTSTERISGTGYVDLVIVDKATSTEALRTNVMAGAEWFYSWNACQGDLRAIPQELRGICANSEPANYNTARRDLYNEVGQRLQKRVKYFLQHFYHNRY